MRRLLLRIFHCSSHPANLLWALVFAVLSIGTISRLSAAKNAKGAMAQEKSPLVVTLKVDKDSYRLGDEIAMQVLLTNRSVAPLYIHAPLDWGESFSLSIWFKDAISGKNINANSIFDALTPPPTSKDVFVELHPDHIYGVVITARLAEVNLKQRGTYEVVAWYHSPIPLNMNFGLPIWSREKGAIPSNRVTFKVTN